MPNLTLFPPNMACMSWELPLKGEEAAHVEVAGTQVDQPGSAAARWFTGHVQPPPDVFCIYRQHKGPKWVTLAPKGTNLGLSQI